MRTESLPLDRIDIHGGTQIRVETNNDAIASYADEMAAGVGFPPITVFFDGTKYWLADGFHRFLAARRIDSEEILADVHEGGRVDALRFALGANSTNGLYRSNADKHNAVEIALEEWPELSNSLLAELCKVSTDLVRRCRTAMTAAKRIAPQETVTGKDGKEYPTAIKREPRGPKAAERERSPDESEGGDEDGGSGSSQPGKKKKKDREFEIGGSNKELEMEARAMVRKGELGFKELDSLESVTAIDYAETAIHVLEKIRFDDPKREQALERISRWLERARMISTPDNITVIDGPLPVN